MVGPARRKTPGIVPLTVLPGKSILREVFQIGPRSAKLAALSIGVQRKQITVSATAVIGLQWGDEAKGKIVHILADQHDIVVRYQGGNNAGHTVVCEGQTYKLSLLPVGMLRPGVVSVIATGTVINPQVLLAEIDQLR